MGKWRRQVAGNRQNVNDFFNYWCGLLLPWISASLRSMVATRARRRCEYCLIHEADTFVGFQIDHIISEKHGGPTEPDNLAYACLFCNIYKGSDIASLNAHGRIVPLFHPRKDQWEEHFRFAGPRIDGLTACGESTARLLRFNDPARIEERVAMSSVS